MSRKHEHCIPVFHVSSAFSGKGKKSTWQAWYEEVNETFMFLAGHPFEHLRYDSIHFCRIERFTKPVSPLSLVNEAMFCQKNRAMDLAVNSYKGNCKINVDNPKKFFYLFTPF